MFSYFDILLIVLSWLTIAKEKILCIVTDRAASVPLWTKQHPWYLTHTHKRYKYSLSLQPTHTLSHIPMLLHKGLYTVQMAVTCTFYMQKIFTWINTHRYTDRKKERDREIQWGWGKVSSFVRETSLSQTSCTHKHRGNYRYTHTEWHIDNYIFSINTDRCYIQKREQHSESTQHRERIISTVMFVSQIFFSFL